LAFNFKEIEGLKPKEQGYKLKEKKEEEEGCFSVATQPRKGFSICLADRT
jgi:hypothetical protein